MHGFFAAQFYRFSALFLALFLWLNVPLHAQWHAQPEFFTETYHAQQLQVASADSAEFFDFDVSPELKGAKSPFLAGALSFVLPGLGEAYAGNFSTGKYSLGVEIGLIAGLVGTSIYANSLESDYQVMARAKAGVSEGEKSEQFWKDISNYESLEAFNQQRLRQRNYDGIYSQENFWQWHTESDRKKYRDLRISSDEAFQATYFIIGAMAVNRLFSAINAVRGVRAHNESLVSETTLRIFPKMYRANSGVVQGIALEKSF